MNDMAVWVEPCTATQIFKCDRGCGAEEHPPAVTENGGGGGAV